MLVADREDLESLALEACPAYLYYDLCDTLEETPDTELWDIIEKYGSRVVVA